MQYLDSVSFMEKIVPFGIDKKRHLSIVPKKRPHYDNKKLYVFMRPDQDGTLQWHTGTGETLKQLNLDNWETHIPVENLNQYMLYAKLREDFFGTYVFQRDLILDDADSAMWINLMTGWLDMKVPVIDRMTKGSTQHISSNDLTQTLRKYTNLINSILGEVPKIQEGALYTAAKHYLANWNTYHKQQLIQRNTVGKPIDLDKLTKSHWKNAKRCNKIIFSAITEVHEKVFGLFLNNMYSYSWSHQSGPFKGGFFGFRKLSPRFWYDNRLGRYTSSSEFAHTAGPHPALGIEAKTFEEGDFVIRKPINFNRIKPDERPAVHGGYAIVTMVKHMERHGVRTLKLTGRDGEEFLALSCELQKIDVSEVNHTTVPSSELYMKGTSKDFPRYHHRDINGLEAGVIQYPLKYRHISGAPCTLQLELRDPPILFVSVQWDHDFREISFVPWHMTNQFRDISEFERSDPYYVEQAEPDVSPPNTDLPPPLRKT